jgi:CPA2 family monovalent cation:H+ antiporter-2
MANLAKAGGLLPVLQPFAALYVLLLAILGPLLTRESERIYGLCAGLLGKAGRWLERSRAPAPSPSAPAAGPLDPPPDGEKE